MANHTRKVLVTGGAGFIGSHVAEAYAVRGDRVWVLDDLSSGRIENVPAQAAFVEEDVASGRAARLIRQERFDVINHQAAQVDVRFSVADPAHDARANVLGLVNVLEAARRAGTKRIVFASSGGVVYGNVAEGFPTPETAPKEPRSPYGVAKLAGEYYLDCYRAIHGLEYVALRYSNVYGPRQNPHAEAGVAAIFSERLRTGDPITIYGDGEQTRDYVFVSDVARANLIATDMSLPRGTGIDACGFNVGTGVSTSVNDLAQLIEEAFGVRAQRQYKPVRDGEVQHSLLDASKLRARGWNPAFGLRQGIRRMFEQTASALPDAKVPSHTS